MCSVRFLCFLGCAALVAAGSGHAQSAAAGNSSAPSGWSSSQAGTVELASSFTPANPAALPSAPSAAGSGAAGQDNGGYSGWHRSGLAHRLTWEVGGGFNAPAGDKTYITWGGQFQVGGGVNFNRYLAMMVEYQFLDSKIPGAIIAESGAQGGHYHIWSFTLDPVIDLAPKASNDVYITGGGGFYRKVTDFTEVLPTEYCDFYGCGIVGQSQTVGSFSSNQGGVNFGAGYQHRLGGMYGQSRTRLFAEARYLYVMSPAVNGSANGLGVTAIAADTKVIPVSVGLRW
jgi:hypothetical protein